MMGDSELDAPVSSDSLDPADWEEFRSLAHTALDEAIAYIRSVRDRPVWRPVPESVRAKLEEPFPVDPQGLPAVYDDFRELVLPFPVGNIHPRFFGWVHGVGLPSGIVAELAAAAMNANCGGRAHVGLYVERAVIAWCRSILGFPEGATGVLLTGTSMANLTGLCVARNARSGDIRRKGLHGRAGALVAYASAEAHHSVARAAEILGLGSEGLRQVPVTEDFRMDLDALGAAIAADRIAGLEPFCVVGTAGTVNTGAIDDLEAIAAICRDEKLWFHVDGAFGALAVLSRSLRPKVAGVGRADSIAFDFHKWMHIQYDAGGLLVRDGEAHRSAFSMRPVYLRSTDRGLAGGGEWPSDLGPELSRGFRALKIWIALKEHGSAAFARAIEKNCRQADHLAGLVRQLPDAELLHTPSLNIVCFRFRPEGWDEPAVDLLNEDVVVALQESGVAVPSVTRIRGHLAIRVNLTNHRTRREDLDLFVRSAAEEAARRIASR
jgi:aromatic-L-amino-acid decarboxylase